MATFDNLVGRMFNRLKVIERAPDYVQPNGHHKTQYVCECSCPAHTRIIVKATHLKDGHCQSCGCLNSELAAKRLADRDRARAKHGKYNDRLYKIHQNMISRCYNKNDTGYTDYGARGIKICEEWCDPNDTLSIEKIRNFYNWAMTHGYEDILTIDRIDNNGNYEPSNCKWATKVEQGNNRRVNKLIDFNGKQYSIGQIANVFNINYDRFYGIVYRSNYNLNNAYHLIQTPYGSYYGFLGKYNNPIPMAPIYYIDRYGCPISQIDYKEPQPTPALWECDDKGFITKPIL